MPKTFQYKRKHAIRITATALSILALCTAPIYAKSQATTPKNATAATIIDGIDFGDNSSQFSSDGECDDPRFTGIGTALDMEDQDIGHDAADCAALYQVGDVTLKLAPQDAVNDIDFGDNASEWSDNQLCDDPRFGGPGSDELLLDEDMGHDANDCKSLFLDGQIEYLGDDPNMTIINFDGILFGDNTSQWKSDGECDDPRFRGTGMAQTLENINQNHDAVDCLALYQSGSITLVQDAVISSPGAIDFGDNSSDYAFDDECDDPRFAGEGVAGILLDADLGHDAADCQALYNAGNIYLAAGGSDPIQSQIYFGDDNSDWPNDGECDDPRFIGEGMTAQLLPRDIGHDATDCQALVNAGKIALINASNVDFGDDNSPWPNDGECDDPRFTGEGVASRLDPRYYGHDASDCQALINSGAIQYIGGVLTVIPVQDLISGSSTSTGSAGNQNATNIDFGDNSAKFSHDGECDDDRFTGPGMALPPLSPGDRNHDAADCQSLFNSGQIELSQTASLRGFHNTGFDFGDNSSQYANNEICDDPRFGGPGADGVLLDSDLGHDAADCRALFSVGQVSLLQNLLINFGQDTSQWANDNECDDPRFTGKSMAQSLEDVNILQDASDCRAGFETGKLYFLADGPIDFGDDTSEWANDNECDDPRFGGPGVASGANDENLLIDAADCRALYRSGQIFLKDSTSGLGPIDFGDNEGSFVNDGECDDSRFFGPGSAAKLFPDNLGHDAADCEILLDAGQIEFGAPLGSTNSTPIPATTNSGNIDFGDDTSTWANDGECDDPRFSGPGTADLLLDDDLGHDATDCRTLLNSGQIQYDGANQGTDTTQSGIDFGDDTSTWANDGECDDPRFSGPGTADLLLDDDLGHDATDCRTLLNSGQIQYDGANQGTGTTQSGVDFGDDTSAYAHDGTCDDPRFEGNGVAIVLLDEDMGHDATDCAALFQSGDARLISGNTGTNVPATNADPTIVITDHGIVFGDNMGPFARDNECDDPRFEGPGVYSAADSASIEHDADDCLAAYNAGTATLGAPIQTPANIVHSGIDFGDDSSDYANNNICDDLRFEGAGVDAVLLPEDEGHDATDCSNLFQSGQVQLTQQFAPDNNGADTGQSSNTGPIDFGDNASLFANDNECDDDRFEGAGMAVPPLFPDHRNHDAADCQAAFDLGTISLIGGQSSPTVGQDPQGERGVVIIEQGIVFGDNMSEFARDIDCDDPRFVGPGTIAGSASIHIEHDADDCLAAFNAGRATLNTTEPVTPPVNNDAGGPHIIHSGIDFGDDTSQYANDNVCDDPRFEGVGTAPPLLPEDEAHDATDCSNQFNAGQIQLIGGNPNGTVSDAPPSGIDFGDDSGNWPNDGECDDARFSGPGMASSISDANQFNDATDCQTLFDAGQVFLP